MVSFALTPAAELIPLFLLISTRVILGVDRITPERIRAVLGRTLTLDQRAAGR
jgi:hypothetical protein